MKLKTSYSTPNFSNILNDYRILNHNGKKEQNKLPNQLNPIQLDTSIFEGIKLTSIDGNEIEMKELWKEQTVVLKVLRRLGCALCKKEAQMLSDLQPLFEKHQIKLVAIVFEDIDLWTFLKSGYWNWDLYLDSEKNVYKAAGLTRAPFSRVIKVLFSTNLRKIVKELFNMGFSSNLKGDMRQLGGTFIINTRSEILYEFRPTKIARFPDIREIYSIIGGNPNEIHQDLPECYLYTREQLKKDTVSLNSGISLDSKCNLVK